MSSILTLLVIAVSGIMAGGLLTGTVLRKAMDRKRDMILKEAMEKAEVLKKEKILQAKEKFLQLKTEHEKFVHEKNEELQRTDNRVKQKEASFGQKIEDLQKKYKEIGTIKQNLQAQVEIVTKKQAELDKALKTQIEKMESIGNLSAAKPRPS